MLLGHPSNTLKDKGPFPVTEGTRAKPPGKIALPSLLHR